MNFVFFSAQYLPTVGGVERYTYNLAWNLIKKGHSVLVITSSLENQPEYECDNNGIKIYRMPVLWFMNNRFPVPVRLPQWKKTIKNIFSQSIDFAVIQTRFYPSSIIAGYMCRKNSVPAMVIEHGSAYLIRNGLVGGLGKFYEHVAAWLMKKNCKNFYGVSLACNQWLKNFGICSKGCIYNAVDVRQLQQKADIAQGEISAKWSFDDGVNICFTGRFIKEKGVVSLAAAFARLNSAFPNTRLFMVGDGPLFEQVKSMDVPNLVLTGRLDHEQTLAVVKNCDIFCLPTYSEGFSTAVLEAAALNTMIITTPTGGSTQLIKDNSCGIIIPSMSEDDIYNALEYALENPDFVIRRANNAYSSLCENFTWDKVSEVFLEECEKII